MKIKFFTLFLSILCSFSCLTQVKKLTPVIRDNQLQIYLISIEKKQSAKVRNQIISAANSNDSLVAIQIGFENISDHPVEVNYLLLYDEDVKAKKVNFSVGLDYCCSFVEDSVSAFKHMFQGPFKLLGETLQTGDTSQRTYYFVFKDGVLPKELVFYKEDKTEIHAKESKLEKIGVIPLPSQL